MLEISGKTNLLEQNAYKYSLQDVAEPNLQRDIYTQGMVPKVPFNHRRVPMNMPEEIWITDTSLRDGQQSVEPYTVDQIVNIYKYLSRLGGPYGSIRQTEFFIYSKKDREALEKCMELGLKFPEITTWIRATKEDFRLVRDLGIRETGILVSCSDYHIFKKMKMTRKQAMDYYLATVADAFEAGVVPRCHLEDITRADFYGYVVPFVTELQKLSRQAGIPVKIRACDTMGYGIPYTEAALPRSVAGIIYGLQQYSDVPSECLEWHGHNDFYKAVVNASTYGSDVSPIHAETADGHARGTMIRLSLLSAPLYPDPRTDQGRHDFAWSVVADAGMTDTLAEASRLNTPVLDEVPRFAPLAQVESTEGVSVLDWVKLADDGAGDLILRLYEAAGGRAEGMLHLTDELAQASIEETAVTESDALDPTLPTALAAAGTQPANGARLTLAPFQLATLRERR